MIVTAMLFAAGFRVNGGHLASMLDSGGMREQMIDLAEQHGVEFAQISAATIGVLAAHLEAGLDAVNPMDGMGSLGHDSMKTYLECGKALLDDPDTGLLSFEFEFRDGFSHYPELFDVARQLADHNDKPLVLVNSCSFTSITETAVELSWQGIPVINGIDVALRSFRNLMQFSCEDRFDSAGIGVCFDQSVLANWAQRLDGEQDFDEVTSLKLMSDFGLPTVDFILAQNFEQVCAAAESYGYPLVLKTAVAGIAHKSDQNGVKVGIENLQQLESDYRDLQQRLGDSVVVMPMVESGVEVSVGMKNDAQFGPMVIVACGGLLIELLAERAFKLAPVNARQANAMLDQTRLAKLLAAVRGRAAVDRAALVDLITRFSELAFALTDSIAEVDLNPVIVKRTGCTIVDALVVPRKKN